MADDMQPQAPSGGLTQQALMQLIMSQGQQGATADKDQKPPPKWMFMAIPGFGKGYAQGMALKQQEEELKMRKQALAGQQAGQKLQQLMMQRKLQEEEQRRRLGNLYKGLLSNPNMGDAERAEIVGEIAAGLAGIGDISSISKLEEAERGRREQQQIEQIEGLRAQGRAEATGAAVPEEAAPEPIAEPEDAGEPPGLTMPPMQVEGARPGAEMGQQAFQRDKLRLAGLDRQEGEMQQRLTGYRRLTSAKGKEMFTRTRGQLKDIQEEKASLHKRMQFTGSPIEQVTGVPAAYLTSQQVMAGGEKLQQRAVTRAQQTQAAGLGALGDKQYAGAMGKYRAELEGAPLGEAVAKQVADMNSLIGFVNDIGQLYQQGFVGKVESVSGAIREFTGNPKKDETEFRRLVEDVKDSLLRARSGAAITEKEYARMARLVPNVSDEPAVFVRKLQGFGQAMETLRDEKLRVATTPRKALIESSPRIQPLPEKAAPAEPPVMDPAKLTPEDLQRMTPEQLKLLREKLRSGK